MLHCKWHILNRRKLTTPPRPKLPSHPTNPAQFLPTAFNTIPVSTLDISHFVFVFLTLVSLRDTLDYVVTGQTAGAPSLAAADTIPVLDHFAHFAGMGLDVVGEVR